MYSLKSILFCITFEMIMLCVNTYASQIDSKKIELNDCMIVADDVIIRDSPSIKGTPVYGLKWGAHISIDGEKGNWLHVKYQYKGYRKDCNDCHYESITGWVNSAFIDPCSECFESVKEIVDTKDYKYELCSPPSNIEKNAFITMLQAFQSAAQLKDWENLKKYISDEVYLTGDFYCGECSKGVLKKDDLRRTEYLFILNINNNVETCADLIIKGKGDVDHSEDSALSPLCTCEYGNEWVHIRNATNSEGEEVYFVYDAGEWKLSVVSEYSGP